MKKKKKISVQTIIEVMIRAVFFIIYPALFSTAFTGIKLIVEQITQRASLQWNSFVQTLVVLLVFTIVFGRFFCGFACAFGSLSDWVRAAYVWVCKKLKKKPVTLGMELTAAVRGMSFPCFMQEILHWKDILRESSCSFSSCVACACRSVFSAVFCARWERYFHFFRYCHILRPEEKGRTVSLAVQHARKNVPRISDCRNWGRLRREATVLCVRNVPASVRKEISTVVSLEN